jgi:hypothetical protein
VLHVDVEAVQRSTAPGPENWGQLLDRLEYGDGPDQQVVTAVRFNGVDEPTFREPSTRARNLRALGSIEVETTTVDALLHESARAAHDSIVPLHRAIVRIASSIRRRGAPPVPTDLRDLLLSFQTLADVTTGVARARENADLARELDGLAERFYGIVRAVAARQGTGDCQAVADVLDGELAASLDEWSSMLRRMLPPQ